MPGKKRSALAVYNELKSETPQDEKEDVQVDSGASSTRVARTSTRKPSVKRKSLEKRLASKEKKRKVESTAKVEVEQTATSPPQKLTPSKQVKKNKQASQGRTAKGMAAEGKRKISFIVEEVEEGGGGLGAEAQNDHVYLDTELTEESSGKSAGGVGAVPATISPPPTSKPSKQAKKKQANVKKMKAKEEDTKVLIAEKEEDGEEDKGTQVDGLCEEGLANVERLSTPFYSQFNPELFADSRVAANELFDMMIRPIPVEQFYREVWEKRPLLIKRHKPHYNDGLFSSGDLQRILAEHYLEYSVNIDITSYKNGERLTHNPAGRAFPSAVWESFKDGCSVRMLNPQTYSESLWRLNSTLQEHFGSFVGANVYLTPAGTQGFAPHYDDIEAFVLQLEGKKQWKLYPPRNGSELLPRYSSSNFSQDEIGTPVMDTVLEAGDLLYFPRGTIHQAMSLPDCHSLHVTLSTYQKNTWGDLLEKLVPAALHSAITEDVELRGGLPTDYLQYMGVINSDMDDQRRTWFCDKVVSMVSNLLKYLPVDAAVDQISTDHMNSCMPPCLTAGEKSCGVWSQGPRWQDGVITDGPKLTAGTQVKLLRHGILRMVVEEVGPVIYHTLENTRIYKEKEVAGLAIRDVDAPAIEQLVALYPDPIAIDSLAIEEGSTEDKIELCQLLFSQGLLLVVG